MQLVPSDTHTLQIFTSFIFLLLGIDSSVGIATCYGLDGPGIECRWGRDFPHPSRPALGPTQPPVQLVPGLYRGVKRPGRGVDHVVYRCHVPVLVRYVTPVYNITPEYNRYVTPVYNITPEYNRYVTPVYNNIAPEYNRYVTPVYNNHAPLSSVEVKERLELYLCSPSGPSWPVLG